MSAILVLLAAAGGALAWWALFRERPQTLRDASIEELFKYGSIGAENDAGLPYWIWAVLPRVFPEYLPGPGGYASLGMAWEEGRETPIGFSRKRVGFDRIAINCALCHTASVRLAAGDANPRLYYGAVSPTLDVQGYQRFLIRCARDPRFNASVLLDAIARDVRLSRFDRLLYRFVLIPGTRRALRRRGEEFAWTEGRTAWGPGRMAPITPIRLRLLGLGFRDPDDLAEIMPMWNMAAREGLSLHWDGQNDDVTEVFRSSAIDNGATRRSIALDTVARLQAWARTLQPPPFPYPIDAPLAGLGRAIWTSRCAACHAPGGERTGRVLPLGEIGTDPHRARAWDREAADAFNRFAEGRSWDFDRFDAPDPPGYVSLPLDGVWLRAPYLHNGSVPTLAALLEPPERRPARFFTGCDVYDPESVGFLSEGPVAEACGRPFDAALSGNGNGGHLWGTDLTAEEKRSLIEYLKSL